MRFVSFFVERCSACWAVVQRVLCAWLVAVLILGLAGTASHAFGDVLRDAEAAANETFGAGLSRTDVLLPSTAAALEDGTHAAAAKNPVSRAHDTTIEPAMILTAGRALQPVRVQLPSEIPSDRNTASYVDTGRPGGFGAGIDRGNSSASGWRPFDEAPPRRLVYLYRCLLR